MKLNMRPTLIKTMIGLFSALLIVVAILIDPRLFLRSSYVATAAQDIKLPKTWALGMTSQAMCAETQNGDSPAFRFDLHVSYVHWNERFMQGKSGETQTLVCKYQDQQGTRYERWDFVAKRGTYEPEVIWHGFRQRGDVNVP
jgi:hypothetical protein